MHPVRSVGARPLAFLACLGVLVAGCSGRPTAAPGPATSSDTSTPTPVSTGVRSPTPTSPSSGWPSCVDRVFGRLTPAQRVGQLFALGLAGDRLGPGELESIHTRHVGSVWFTETTSAGTRAVRAVANAVQAQATSAATGGVRFYVAANQEGGLIQALSGPGFATIPSAAEQGTAPPATLRQEAASWGHQLVQAGVNLDFAPVLDVVPPGTDALNAPIGMLHREYGHDPATVARQGTAFIAGMTSAGVATTAKHFPGLGRVRGNTDDVAGVVDDVTTSSAPSLLPFRAAATAGVPFVMVALASYPRIDPGHLAAFSTTVMRLLRTQLGFAGVIMSDDLGATAAVSAIPPGQRAVAFLSAGGDLVVSKTVDATDSMVDAVLSRAAADPAFASRVADAVHHLLAAKAASGLLACSDR